MFDVGPGEAIVLRAPTGEAVLIDGGRARRASALGEDLGTAIPPGSLNAIVASKRSFDHLGSIERLLRRHPSRLAPGATFYEPGGDQASSPRRIPRWWLRLLERFRSLGVRRRPVTRPIRPEILGKRVDVTLCTASSGSLGGEEPCLFMRVTFGGARLLFTGDAEWDAEHRLLDRFGRRAFAHALKVTNHGRLTGTGLRFVDAVRPGIAFASTCDARGYRWDDAVRRRLPRECRKFETWRHGDIVLRTDGRRHRRGFLFHVETVPGVFTLGSRRPWERRASPRSFER